MPVKDSDNPLLYKGPRTLVVMSRICGFCNARDCDKCCHEIPYFEKLWVCPCECNKGWVPQDLGSTSLQKKTRRKNEVRYVQLSGEAGQPSEDSTASGDLLDSAMPEGEGSLEGRTDDIDNEPQGE